MPLSSSNGISQPEFLSAHFENILGDLRPHLEKQKRFCGKPLREATQTIFGAPGYHA